MSSSPLSRVPKTQVPTHASRCPVLLSLSHFYTQPSKMVYRKILKIIPGAYIFPRLFLRGLFWGGLISGGAYLQIWEGNLCFKINWASLIVGNKFTVFALFYFVFEGNFLSTSPLGANIWRGDLTEGFLCYRFGELIFGGAYFRNFTVREPCTCKSHQLYRNCKYHKYITV